MKSIKDMSMKELAAFLCQAMAAEGILVVLSGGSCVEIYSDGKYTSSDLDLINRYNESPKKIRKVMLGLGFAEHGRYFTHEDTDYFVEFPSGPLGVGDSPIVIVEQIHTETGILSLLTPTDCVKDRLAAYFHWNDEQSLQQAVWVAQSNAFDYEAVKKWSVDEGRQDKFETFSKQLIPK